MLVTTWAEHDGRSNCFDAEPTRRSDDDHGERNMHPDELIEEEVAELSASCLIVD